MPAPADIASETGLLAVGQREIAALSALVAATEPGQSVHGARRRIKQLRSLLRLLRHGLGEAAYHEANGALRTAADALAGHRRAEALVVAAARLEPEQESGTWFWRRLAEAHRAAHAADGDPARSLATARQAIRRAEAVLTRVHRSERGGEDVGAAFLAAYGKARKRLRKALAGGDAVQLHEARKFVIHHLHHLALLHPGRDGRLRRLEALREMLGDLNDLDELEQLAAGAPRSARDVRRMRKARNRHLGKAEEAARKLFRHKPGAFDKRLGHARGPRSRHTVAALEAGE